MSAETKAALEAALEAHLRDEATPDSLLTGYVAYVAFLNSDTPDERTSYALVTPGGQPYHSTLGLAHSLLEDIGVYAGGHGDD